MKPYQSEDSNVSDSGVCTPAKRNSGRGRGESELKTPDTERRRRILRQQKARQRVQRQSVSKVLLTLLAVLLLGVAVFGLSYHEWVKASCNWADLPPSNFDSETQQCKSGFKRLGCFCVSGDDFRDHKHFFGRATDLERSLKMGKFYQCAETDSASSQTDIASFFSSHNSTEVESLWKEKLGTDAHFSEVVQLAGSSASYKGKVTKPFFVK